MNSKSTLEVVHTEEHTQLNLFEERLKNLLSHFPNFGGDYDPGCVDDDFKTVTFYPIIPSGKFNSIYPDLVRLILEKLICVRNGEFQSILDNKTIISLDKNTNYSRKVLDINYTQIKYPIKVFAIQTDGRYKGVSPEDIMSTIPDSGCEFPLDLVTLGMMFLSDRSLLTKHEDTGIVCAANRVILNSDINYPLVPVFRVNKIGKLVLDLIPLNKKGDMSCSAATGFRY